jgi:hypothetical protein
MATLSPSLAALSLEPIDGSSRTAGTPVANSNEPAPEPVVASRPSSEELAAFMATAAREYETGWIDRPLWESILAQSKGDEALAKGVYLRTRATILQLDKRDKTALAASEPTRGRLPANPPAQPASREPAHAARAQWMPAPWMIAAAAVACVVVGLVAWVIMRSGNAEITQTASAEKPAAAATADARKAPAVPVSVGSTAAVASADDGLVDRIAQLSEAGNWNVVVLLSTEWTRREPGNVHAWAQLATGYSKLRQLGEALDAATKATQLAPGDPLAWRTLGEVNLDLDRAADALRAFEQAVALDAADTRSLVRVGMLDAQLSRLSEAKVAFDTALSANPDNVDAACGQALVARQQGLQKDAETIERALQARGRDCRGSSQGQVAKVAVRPASPARTASAQR